MFDELKGPSELIFPALMSVATDPKAGLEERLKAAEQVLAGIPNVEWSPAYDVGSSKERIAYIDWCGVKNLVNALAHRITDLKHPPTSNFMKHQGLLGWDHPDFGYIMDHVRCSIDDGTVNPTNEALVAGKLRELCVEDYEDDPSVLEGLIDEFVGCRPL